VFLVLAALVAPKHMDAGLATPKRCGGLWPPECLSDDRCNPNRCGERV